MPVPSEAIEKERRLWRALERLGYDSIIITQRDNFAWLTCGGRAVQGYGVPLSPVVLVLAQGKKYAVGLSIDLVRTGDEELNGLGYELLSLPSFGKTPAEAAMQVAAGKVAADSPVPGADDISRVVATLYEPFTPEEMARYDAIARESGLILHELAYWVRPGMTERQAAAHAWELYVSAGFEVRYMFVGADERLRKYRHPVFTDKPIESGVMFAPACTKYGLLVPNTRMVYFAEPPADIRRRFNAVSTMLAAMLKTIRPGVKMTVLRELVFNQFDILGYPEEKFVHFHGGPLNYQGSSAARLADPNEVVAANTAFAWYFTVAGAKTEEVMLVDERGVRLCTVDPHWPMLTIEFEGVKEQVPDILVR